MVVNMDWSEKRRTLQDQGYVIIKDLIEDSYFKDIEEAFLAFLNKHSPNAFGGFSVKSLMDNQGFHDAFVDLKRNHPRISGAIYDSMQSSYAVIKLSINPLLIEAISQLAGVPPTSISNFDHSLRMDVPYDQRNIISWHQDTFNDEAYHDYEAGITGWMPLHKVNRHNGGLVVCPGSHHERVERKVTQRADPNSSLEYHFPMEYVKKFEIVNVEMERGDVLLLSMNLAHASGKNNSNKVRYTVQTRYYPFTEANFVAGRPVYKSSVL